MARAQAVKKNEQRLNATHPPAVASSKQPSMGWADYVNLHCATSRTRLGKQLRELVVTTAFTGTNASGEVMKELGIKHRHLFDVDPKAAALHFRQQNGLEAPCSFKCIRRLNEAGAGKCWRHHPNQCRLPSTQADLAVLGFPCRPYSACRTGSGSAENVAQHPEFDLTEHAIRFVANTRPFPVLFKCCSFCAVGQKVLRAIGG